MRVTFFLLFFVLLVGCDPQTTPPSSSAPTAGPLVVQPAGETATVDQAEGDAEAAVASPKVEYSSPTPIDAVTNFTEGIVNDNFEQAQSAVVLNDRVKVYLLASIKVVVAMDSYAQADNKYFGEEGAMPVGLIRASMLGGLKGAKVVSIDDDHAEVMINPPAPMKLVRNADGWKVDFTGPKSMQLLEMTPRVFGNTAHVFDQVRTGIEDGTIATREEARQELKRLKAEFGL